MTRQQNFFEGETVSDDKDAQSPGSIIKVETLWITQFREDPTYSWVDIGTHKADAASVVRVYDYGCEHHADKEHRITRTDILVTVEDTEELRENLRQMTARKDDTGLQSE